jgi:pimeloyl-ACP methyl ester carboxylesterase
MKHSLLLLSGLLCDESFWTDIPRRLAPFAEVSIVTFRGFSSIEAMARHVLDHAPESFAVAGHSMGGRVALEIIRLEPRRITGLALLNTGVHGVRDGEPQSRARLIEIARRHGMSVLAAEWLPTMLGSETARSAALMRQLTAMIEHWTPKDYADQMAAMLHRREVLPLLSTITVPTLLLSGSNDNSSPVSQQQSMRRKIPHATLFEIHGAGHMAPAERPDSVALALREWLQRIRPVAN